MDTEINSIKNQLSRIQLSLFIIFITLILATAAFVMIMSSGQEYKRGWNDAVAEMPRGVVYAVNFGNIDKSLLPLCDDNYPCTPVRRVSYNWEGKDGLKGKVLFIGDVMPKRKY